MKSCQGLLDSHFHLAQIEAPKEVLSELFDEGFLGGINICLSEDDLGRTESLVKPYPSLLTAFGMGPWETEDPLAATGALVQRIRKAKATYGFSLLGEFGIDLHWPSYGSMERQMELFEAELALAKEFQMPVVIHIRDAMRQTEEILRAWDNPFGGIIHCFSGDGGSARRLAEMGYYVSFAGNITYKHSENLAQALRALPLERILLETDSPYLAPEPFRGRKNDPRHMKEIYAFAAKILGMEDAALAKILAGNFARLAQACPGKRTSRSGGAPT